MNRDPVMRRLRAANPVPPQAPAADALFQRLVSEPGDVRLAGRDDADGRRRRPARRLTVPRAAVLAAGVAGLAAAAVVIVGHAGAPGARTPGGTAPSGGFAAIDPTAATVLDRLASDAAGLSTPHERYLVLRMTATYSRLPGRRQQIMIVDGLRAPGTTIDSSGLSSRGGTRALTRSSGQIGFDALIDPLPIFRDQAWFDSLATIPATLRSELVPLGALVTGQQLGTAVSQAEARAGYGHAPGTAASNPRSAAARADDVYEAAIDLLWSPRISPAVRAALYRILATTPGVRVDAHATDPAGRPAIAMSRADTQADSHVRSTTWENPRTGAVLAQRVSVQGPHAPETGTSTAVFQPVQTTNTPPRDPFAR